MEAVRRVWPEQGSVPGETRRRRSEGERVTRTGCASWGQLAEKSRASRISVGRGKTLPMSPHYDFDAPRFQKVVMAPTKHSARQNSSRAPGSGEIREHVIQLVRMFAGVDVDLHGALQPFQLIRARIGNDRYDQRRFATIHCARVLEDERPLSTL